MGSGSWRLEVEVGPDGRCELAKVFSRFRFVVAGGSFKTEIKIPPKAVQYVNQM